MWKCDFNKVAKLLCNVSEIALRHGCSAVNLLHIFRTPFLKNTFGWLLWNMPTNYLGQWLFKENIDICYAF